MVKANAEGEHIRPARYICFQILIICSSSTISFHDGHLGFPEPAFFHDQIKSAIDVMGIVSYLWGNRAYSRQAVDSSLERLCYELPGWPGE